MKQYIHTSTEGIKQSELLPISSVFYSFNGTDATVNKNTTEYLTVLTFGHQR